MNIKKNDEIKLNIDSLTSEGAGVGRYEGIAVFVRGTVPGDVIICHIIKTAKRYCIGIIKGILVPSPSRIESDCDVSDKCGGCSFRNMTYNEELKYKQQRVADAIKRIGHLDVGINSIVGADSIYEYRNKAQYPVFIENSELKAGFYAYKSHRIIACDGCKLQNKAFDECLRKFSSWVKKAEITSYSEATGEGLLRHIFLRTGEATGEIMACAVINGDVLPDAEYLINQLREISSVRSICYNVNKERSNVILGDKTVHLWGSETIKDILCGKTFEISPDSFYQVNHSQCEKLYEIAGKYAALKGSETLVDLYCGAGTIGLTMAERAKRVFGIEIVPQAIENAKRNAAINGINNAEFFCGDAYEGAKELERRGIKADVVILDPPRKGCQSELFDVIKRMNPERIVYVSCDSSTLARDLEILKAKGYETQEITPVDMFPRTPHVEAVAKIKRE